MSIISESEFYTVCINQARCVKARCQVTTADHLDSCGEVKVCTETATWGPKGSKKRIYCKACKTDLIKRGYAKDSNSDAIDNDGNLLTEYEINSNKCMGKDCTEVKKSKIKYGLRGTKFATHCCACAKELRLVNTSEAVCEYIDKDGTDCLTQAKCQVGDQNYCKTHGRIIADQTGSKLIDKVLKCIIEGCKLNRAKKQYCGSHAIDHIDGYKRTSGMCCVHGTTRASFKLKDADGGAKYCKDCTRHDPEAFESTNPMCMVCKETRSSWAYGLTAQPTRCKKCTPKDNPIWISVNTGRTIVEQLTRDALIKPKDGCQTAGCTVKSPSFGLLWKQPTHCQDHKSDDLINVVSIKCPIKDCNKHRSYGYDWRKPIVCKTHSTGGMENVVSKRCAECKIIASYGYDWQRPTHCMTHGLQQDPPMLNVVSKLCTVKGCSTRPIFGLYGGSPTHCSAHKADQMCDVTHIMCLKSDCTKRACFGTEINTPEYCITHKTDKMEDVVHTKCLDETCMVRPSFGFEFGSAKYCVNHKADDMIDVVSKRCESDGCYSQASFNHKGLMAKLCEKHKLDGMINVKATECGHEGCSTQASFANKGEVAKYCFIHKADSMINVRSKWCLVETCNTQANNERYKGYCFNCFYDNYPDEPLVFNYKVKEKAIMTSISCAFTEHHIDVDKVIIGSGCSRRPDGLIKAPNGNHNIVIEIDEFQHKRKGYSDDDQRELEIFAALDNQPLTVIRFNPDHFDGLSNSLFTKDKSTGRDMISDIDRYNQAIVELVSAIQHALDNAPEIPKHEENPINRIKLRFDTL